MQNTKLGSKRVVLLTGLSRIIWIIWIFSTAEKDHVLQPVQAHGAHGLLLYVGQLLLQLHHVLRLVVHHLPRDVFKVWPGPWAMFTVWSGPLDTNFLEKFCGKMEWEFLFFSLEAF